MTHATRVKRAEDEIAAQDKIIADAEATKAAALSRKADLLAFIRVEQSIGDEWVDSPILGALTAASDSLLDSSKRGAKKRAILSVLKAFNQPMSTANILLELPPYGITGATVENTSPQLSGYKADGLVELDSNGWSVTPKGRAYLAEKN